MSPGSGSLPIGGAGTLCELNVASSRASERAHPGRIRSVEWYNEKHSKGSLGYSGSIECRQSFGLTGKSVQADIRILGGAVLPRRYQR